MDILDIGKEKRLVPVLRFKGFDGEWTFEELGKYLKQYVEKVPANTDIPILTSSRTGLYRQSDYFDNRELPNKGEYGVVPKGFFTYRHMSDDSTFKFNVNNLCDRGAVSKEYPVFTTINMDTIFLYHKLNYGRELKRFAIQQKLGGTRVRLYYKKLQILKLYTTTLPEQKKIATFLSAIDKKIQQLTHKKALLEQYKKGLMQQLFSGALRFQDEEGKDYPDWEEKRLGEVCDSIKSGKSRSSENGAFPLYGSTGIIGVCQDYSHQGTFILIARVGANAGKINLIEDKFGVSDNTLVLICSEQISNVYIYNYLAHYNLNRLVFGSGQPLITGGQLKMLKLKLPNVEEQQKIATYLSSIDTKIATISTQITKTQTFKKGLLQQMFV